MNCFKVVLKLYYEKNITAR